MPSYMTVMPTGLSHSFGIPLNYYINAGIKRKQTIYDNFYDDYPISLSPQNGELGSTVWLCCFLGQMDGQNGIQQSPGPPSLGVLLCLKFLVYQEAYAAWQRRMIHLLPHGIWDARLETLNSLC